MNFDFTDEQVGLQDTLRRFLERDYTFARRREIAASEDGYSRAVWKQLAELGLLALPLPAEYGGLDGTSVDIAIVMEAVGRGLLLEPYLPTVVLAGALIRDSGSHAQKGALLPAIAAGERVLALAHFEPGGRYETTRVATVARREAGDWLLTGSKAVVLHGAAADQLLVSARTSGGADDAEGISLFLVDRGARGMRLRAYRTHDGGRAAEVSLDAVRVGAEALVGEAGAAAPLIEHALDRANAALCAEAVGAMSAVNDATLEYLKTRQQFGVPIGRFQALQHRMVDMVIALEQARSMMYLAAVKADAASAAERARAVSAAKALVGQSARFVGQQAVQLHGGMGVTDELSVGHYFKRLALINATFGDADHHLGRFSDALLAAE